MCSLVPLLLLLWMNSSKAALPRPPPRPAPPHPNSIEAWSWHQDKQEQSVDPSNCLAPDAMIEQAGFPVETHTVEAGGGFLLTLHRIPAPGASPVFLQHGLLSSSADWVVTGPETGLAFRLARAGYDVWLGNYRGNTYSRGHTQPDLPPDLYWDFSWDEMAREDLPAMLSYMLTVTGQENYFYIGHSMGTLTFYTACNSADWVCSKARLMVGLGPHTVIPHLTSPLFRLLATWAPELDWILQDLGVRQFAPSSWLTRWLARKVCRPGWGDKVCENVLFLMAGYNPHETNTTDLPFILGHTPAGTSTRTMLHYAQSVNRGSWAGYDWGSPESNQARWNSSEPPQYSYSAVTCPTALAWADSDWLVVPQDVATLAARLPRLVWNYRLPEPAYTHLDFLWGLHNPELLHSQILSLMQKY